MSWKIRTLKLSRGEQQEQKEGKKCYLHDLQVTRVSEGDKRFEKGSKDLFKEIMAKKSSDLGRYLIFKSMKLIGHQTKST